MCNPKSTNELEALGWLKMPTAKANFVVNPKLQELYSNFDSYARSNYNHCKNQWKTGALVFSTSLTFENQPSQAICSTMPPIQLKAAEPTLPPKNLVECPLAPSNVEIRPLKTTFKTKKLKNPKSKTSNTRKIYTTCPCCMSTLTVTNYGYYECSGDKLKLWEKEFLLYLKMSDEQKVQYLLNFNKDSLFLELFDKWNFVDPKTGKRPKFECGFSNRLVNPISRFRTMLPDPIVVKRIERHFKRTLAPKEITGDTPIWRQGNTYFKNYKKGRIKAKIPFITFPDSIL